MSIRFQRSCDFIAETAEVENVMQRIVGDDSVKTVLWKGERIEICDDPIRLYLKIQPLCPRACPVNALYTEINGCQIHSTRSELECEVSFAAAEFEHAWPIGDRTLKKMPVFIAKKDLEELWIMPDLGILGILPHLAPVAGFFGNEFIVLLRAHLKKTLSNNVLGETLQHRIVSQRDTE
jgi:hypothetical protein